MFITTILLNNLKGLSDKRTLSQVLQYHELTKKYNDTFSKYPWQMFILPLESESNLARFSEFTKNHVLSYHVWFVVFWGPTNKKLQDFCEKPDTNRFHLKFDTRMLVKCYDDPKLREWYSVNSSNEVMTNDLMEWRKETGLVLKTSKNLYQRRYDVGGTILRVSSVKVVF